MAVLIVQRPTLSGAAPTFGAASAGGDSFANDGDTMLHVKNGGAGVVVVTVDSATLCSYGFDHNITVSVPAGGERMIGRFLKARFDDADGRVNVSYDGVTSVTVAAIKS